MKTDEFSNGKLMQGALGKGRDRLCFVLLAVFAVAVALAINLMTSVKDLKTVLAMSSGRENRQTVILDAGHGGFDGGAVASDGTVEKNINLKIAKQLCTLLTVDGFQVVMTRTEDIATDTVKSDEIRVRKRDDLKNRLALMREYPDAVFVSIHLNKFTTGAACGAQVFYAVKTDGSESLADQIQSTVTELMQPENTRVVKPGSQSAYLLDRAVIPAVIVECGFLSNRQELEKLKNKDYQNQLAFAIAIGIERYFSAEYKGTENACGRQNQNGLSVQ